MNFVGSDGIPNQKFAVLRRAHEVASFSGPMHSIDFGQVTAECSPGTNFVVLPLGETWDLLSSFLQCGIIELVLEGFDLLFKVVGLSL